MKGLNDARRACTAAFTLIALVSVSPSIRADEPNGRAADSPVFHTEAVRRGDLNLVVRATGTLEPEEVVDVGAQVAGTVVKFGADPAMANGEIYWNSKVDAGTVLAYIDDSSYRNARDTAKANVKKSQALLAGAQASLGKASAEYARVNALLAKQAIGQADVEAAKFAVDIGKANVEAAKAQVGIDEVGLKQAETNLENTRIKSPAKGVVIDRRVNIGQTVAASLSAPSLFLIAQDLTKLQIWASVSEADVAQIHAGQNATYTVEAFGDREFKGRVSQVRLNATMNQNVVTYTVVVDTDNSDGKLLPYETATLEFDAGHHDNVLLVPNGALQWRPVGAQLSYVAPGSRAALGKGHPKQAGGAELAAATTKTDKGKLDRGTVWIYDGQWLRPVRVKIGVTDQVNTEITSGDIKQGDAVVIGEAEANTTENPFAPKIFKGGKK